MFKIDTQVYITVRNKKKNTKSNVLPYFFIFSIVVKEKKEEIIFPSFPFSVKMMDLTVCTTYPESILITDYAV